MPIFQERPMDEWVQRMRAAGIPCSPVRDFLEVTADAQTAVRGMFPEIQAPGRGPHRVTGPPIKLSGTPGRVTTAAPALGEHTAAVLSQLLGLDRAEIERLSEAGVITVP
jgi:crotonobetainyl-CoA:carnitine CoA-transferase CaiB-like acyl-CoA transferase